MSCLAHVPMPERTPGVAVNQTKIATSAHHVEHNGATLFSDVCQQGTTQNLTQYPAPATALYEVLLATAAATACQEDSSYSEESGAPRTQAPLREAAILTAAPVEATDNHVFAQRPFREDLAYPVRTEATRADPQAILTAGAVHHGPTFNNPPDIQVLQATVTLRPGEEVSNCTHGQTRVLEGFDHCNSNTADGLAATTAEEKTNGIATPVQCSSHHNNGTRGVEDNSGVAVRWVPQNITTAVTACNSEWEEASSDFYQVREAAQPKPCILDHTCGERGAVGPSPALRQWSHVPLAMSVQQGVLDRLRRSWPVSPLTTAAGPHPEKQDALEGARHAAVGFSARRQIYTAQQPGWTNSDCGIPDNCFNPDENTTQMVSPPQGQARSSLTGWCWDTGKCAYPDACTPRMWSTKTSATAETAGDLRADESCYLRSLRCVSSTELDKLSSRGFPDSATCNRVQAACSELAKFCGFALSPGSSLGEHRGDGTFHRAGSRAIDWLAAARGRDSTAPFCRISLEEAAGDGLCNPHQELQSLADVLREEEDATVSVPPVSFTNETRGIQAHDGFGFHWRDVGLSATDGDLACAFPPDPPCYSGARSPGSPISFSATTCYPSSVPADQKMYSLKSSNSSHFVADSADTLSHAGVSSSGVVPPYTATRCSRPPPSSAPVTGGPRIPQTRNSSAEVGPVEVTIASERPSSAAAAVEPSSEAGDTLSSPELEDCTTFVSLGGVNAPSSAASEGAELLHQCAELRSRAAGSRHPRVPTKRLAGDKSASPKRSHVPPQLQCEALGDQQAPPDRSQSCSAPVFLLSEFSSPTAHLQGRPACNLEHTTPTEGCGSCGSVGAGLVTAPTKHIGVDAAASWPAASAGDTYALAANSSVQISCSTSSQLSSDPCWTQNTDSVPFAQALHDEERLRVPQTGGSAAKEGHGGIPADVSTSPSMCCSGSGTASPLVSRQGVSVATTSSTTPRRGTLAQCSTESAAPATGQNCLALPPTSVSSFREQASAESEIIASNSAIRSDVRGNSIEVAQNTSTTKDIFDSCSSSSGPSTSSASGVTPAIGCSLASVASTCNSEEGCSSPLQQVLACPAIRSEEVPTAPAKPEIVPSVKPKLNRLEFSALPAADFSDASHAEDGVIPFPQYASTAAGGCTTRAASESVPTPSTATHSSPSPLSFSPISSDGDATAGVCNASGGLEINSTRQQYFISAPGTDGSRDTPSSMGACVVSTPATALSLADYFSEKEGETNAPLSSAQRGDSPRSLKDAADPAACHNARASQCGILCASAQSSDLSRAVDPAGEPLSLSTDAWMGTTTPAGDANEALRAAPQESAERVGSAQGSAPTAGAGPGTAKESVESMYPLHVSPGLLQAPPASLTETAAQTAHRAVPRSDSPHASQETKLETLKYVLAGSEGDVSQDTQYTANLLQQQLATALLSKDLSQTYQQWWYSNCESLQCRQQQSSPPESEDSKLAGEQPEYSENDSAASSACSGVSYASTAACKDAVSKYVQRRETGVIGGGKLHVAVNGGTKDGYAPADDELLEYEEQWDGSHCTAFGVGEAGPTAVPVRTRKGFRKPLPLPQEMLACPGESGDTERGNEPVLQYDVSSREWRVFWVEDRLARYKVFQAKKFGKERAQQLAEDWYRRARAGDVSGSGRGLRSGVRGHLNPKSKKMKVEL